MKKISREKQMMKNGGEIKAGDSYAIQCTTCYWSTSGNNRATVANRGKNHFDKYHTKKAAHRWVWLRDG